MRALHHRTLLVRQPPLRPPAHSARSAAAAGRRTRTPNLLLARRQRAGQLLIVQRIVVRIAETPVRRTLVGRHEQAAARIAAEQLLAVPAAVRHLQRRVAQLVLQLDADQRLRVARRQADPLDQAVQDVQHVGGHLNDGTHFQPRARDALELLGSRVHGGSGVGAVGVTVGVDVAIVLVVHGVAHVQVLHGDRQHVVVDGRRRLALMVVLLMDMGLVVIICSRGGESRKRSGHRKAVG